MAEQRCIDLCFCRGHGAEYNEELPKWMRLRRAAAIHFAARDARSSRRSWRSWRDNGAATLGSDPAQNSCCMHLASNAVAMDNSM